MNGPGWTPEVSEYFDKVYLQPPEESEVTEEEVQDAEDRYQEELCERFKSGDL